MDVSIFAFGDLHTQQERKECVAVFYGANCEDYVSWVNLGLVAWWLPAVIVSQEGYPMPVSPRVSKEKYIESMRAEMEGLLGEVMQAVNDAPGGRVIVDSEEQVRQLMHEFRQRAYERAVQLRADSAESAFPPPENEATRTRMRDKGRQKHTLMTANGRIRVWRKRWQPASGAAVSRRSTNGSTRPARRSRGASSNWPAV